jgi:elongation factor Ts
MEKFYKDICLLEQAFIRDEERTIDDLVKEQITKTGENMVVRRFARFELGESLE